MKKSNFCRCSLSCAIVVIVGVALIGCSKTNGSASSTSSTAPKVTPWPPLGYVAMDYGEPGQPHLSPSDIAKIQSSLTKVKVCQRPLVRYTYYGSTNLVLFFAGPLHALAHVFGEGNEYYLPAERTTLVPPPDASGNDAAKQISEGIQWDVDHQPCPPHSK